jgi:hypothetical protein
MPHWDSSDRHTFSYYRVIAMIVIMIVALSWGLDHVMVDYG